MSLPEFLPSAERMVYNFAHMAGFALGQSLVCEALREENERRLTAIAQQEAYLARFDNLTGLLNRRGIEDSANEHLQLSESVGLLFIDLDGFKTVNDKHGHHTGDQLLRSVAATMSRYTRKEDLVGRLGGDEFIIIADTTPKFDDHERRILTPDERMQLIAKRINDNLLIDAEDRGIPLERFGMSAGYVLFNPNKHDSFNDLVQEADDLMFQQKRLKKSR